MATTRQIEANQANAKRSTGPVTAAGKQASSQNALRHGLLSGCRILKGESKQRWEALLDSLIQEFQPSTPNEFILVESMASAHWRTVRVVSLQDTTLEMETANLEQGDAAEQGSDPVLAATAFGKSADRSQSLHLLQRYEAAFHRQYSRALNNLRKCRADQTLHPQTPDPQTKTQPRPQPPATPRREKMAEKILPLPIEANSPPSRPSPNKVVGPAALAALRFQSSLNREYRILHLRKPIRVTQTRKLYGARLSSNHQQSRQTRLARSL